MKTISLKLDEDIFGETERILARIKKPRNRYINDALRFYNRLQRERMLEKKLQQESEMVHDDSVDVLRDFEAMDYGD